MLLSVLFCSASVDAYGQNNTQIRGFVDASATFNGKKLSFGLGEQDLFITSDITDRLSFLGETVFKFDPFSETDFSVSIERIVLKYNIKGNHNILLGKHHTPINYWNDTYHHGRVFFPTISRPLFFSTNLFPLHTTGVSFQGQNLGTLKFGYDVMFGNGLSSSDVLDNDASKSMTVAVHIRPQNALRIGLSYYRDIIAKGADLHHGASSSWQIDEHLITASVASFGEKVEVLAESMAGVTQTDSTGSRKSVASYVYAGYKVTDKITPYVRFDHLRYQQGEIGFLKNNTESFLAGIRYQLNYLAVIKLEYQRHNSEMTAPANTISTQVAIGF
ncbi:hypothetical protein [Rufibacter hautae]|uniref:Porin n=1 Tax=Rufibacter hautae TaxID=2595005 RepID=A0A5B6TJ91_9BACT|nr:hypothetical protein [Rufibacter hautae]KAA3440333.1 hypothetical protein FOA19_06665 [Rufibacter hautae]